MKTAIRPCFSTGWIARPLVLGLIAVFIVMGGAAPAASQDVSVGYCAPNSPPQDLTLFVGELNVGVPLPSRFSNGTRQPVTFTTTMKTNRFFGPERVVDRRTIGPGLSVTVFHLFIGVNETTPLGTGTVVIEVTSNATGTTVLGRCTFNLTVTRMPEQRDVIGIPLRPCFLEGTQLGFGVPAFDHRSGRPIQPEQLAPPQDVISLIDQINDRTWLKHARIAFRAAISRGVPVLKDLDTQPLSIGGPPTRPGEIQTPGFGAIANSEAAMLKATCELAWQGIDPSQKGIPVVFVRRIFAAVLGFVPGADSALIQREARLPANMSTRLCQHPRPLEVGDVTRVGWTVLLEPSAPTSAHTLNTLAHELGHTLLLGHGNGLDDDGNGTPPPQSGPRRFDDYCDTMGLDPEGKPLEDRLTPFVSCEQTESLMHVSRSDCFNLRPLQVEQARAAAKKVPGAAFEASADPAGAFASDETDPSSTGVPADVLIASIEIAETPELALLEISQTVVGALPNTAHNRYTTIVDLDNNPGTGCNPAELGLPTEFAGAELVTSVLFEATGGPSPQLSPMVWRCEAGRLVPLSAVDIEARASDAELLHVGGRLLGRIGVLIPSNQVDPHTDVVRVQAMAEQLGARGKMSRVPASPDAGGLISLPAPILPICAVSAPVVNPGSITRVQAEGLLPGEPVDILVGGELVGAGEVNGSGVVDVELPIPSTSSLGLRPVTVQVRETLSLATCEVEVVGNAVTPVTTASVTPEPNAAGWNNSPVTVTLTAVSEGATVTSLTFSATGAQAMPEETVAGGAAVIPISTEGETTLTYFAIDSSGRIEPAAQLVIRIDTIPPSMACSVSPERLWPPNHKLVTVTTSVAVEDSLSGGAEFILTSVTSNEPDTGLHHGDRPNDIQGFDIGTPDTSGQLRAERSRRGNGRVYTLTYKGMDVAGNTAMCVTQVEVPDDHGKH
jgi:hypothetical protein